MRLPYFLAAILLVAAQPVQAKDVRIGVGLSKPPYVLVAAVQRVAGKGERKDAHISGLEVEIVAQALAAGGYRMVAESYPPTRALALIRAGQLDGMATITEGIGAAGYYSENYIAYYNVALTLQQRAIRLDGVADLARHSLAAFQNARFILTPEFAAATDGHPNYREYSEQITQNRLLYSGRVDVVVGDRLIFRSLIPEVANDVDTSQAITVHELFPPTPRKMIFRDRAVRDAFNAGLKIIRQNGRYAGIEAKYSVYLLP